MLSAEGLEEEGGYKSLLPTISIDERKCQAIENKGNRQFGVGLSSHPLAIERRREASRRPILRTFPVRFL
jgi:hypothetical protein